MFYVAGMLEFWKALQTHASEGADVLPSEEAAGADKYLDEAIEMFGKLEQWLRDQSLRASPGARFREGPDATRLADVMCMASLARVLGTESAKIQASGDWYVALIKEAMHNCERHEDTQEHSQGCQPRGGIFSSKTALGQTVERPRAPLPGHSIEVVWFSWPCATVYQDNRDHQDWPPRAPRIPPHWLG